MSTGLFFAFAATALAGALGTVVPRRDVTGAALSLSASIVSLAGLCVLLDATLVTVLVLLVLAATIPASFVMATLLLGAERGERASGPARHSKRPVAKLLGAVLVVVALAGLLTVGGPAGEPSSYLVEGFGGARLLARDLFGEFLLAFEVTALFLLAASVGAAAALRREPREPSS